MLTLGATLRMAGLAMLSWVVLVDAAWAAPPTSVDWLIQPGSSSLTYGGTMATVEFDGAGNLIIDSNGNPVTDEMYKVVPQTDAGTSFPLNSLVTTFSGRFSSTGTTFLSSLNLGPRPAAGTSFNQLRAADVNSGLWLPNAVDAGGTPGTFGSPSPAAAGFTFQGISGNAVPDGGRAAFYGQASNISSNNVTMPVTISPDFKSATFSPLAINHTGVFGLSMNYNGKDFQIDPPIALSPEGFFRDFGLSSLSASSDFPSSGFYTRNGSDYVMHTVYGAHLLNMAFAGPTLPGPGFQSDFLVTVNAVAKANLRAGDNNFDGIVDVSDIQLIASNFLKTGAFRPGNANGDGIVDVSDIQTIAANFLLTTPPLPGSGAGVTAPEPGSLLILSVGALSLVAARRRWRG